MATEGNKRSAIAAFKKRHPVLRPSVSESGNVVLRVDALVEGTRELRLFHANKNLFHPIAAFSRSISRVTRRAAAFADNLFDFELSYRNTAPGLKTSDLSRAYSTLLDSYEAFLFSLEAHFDDLKGVAACFWEEPPKKVRSAHWNQFATELEAISDSTAYLVNKIKHNQATLCGFHSVASTTNLRLPVPGFILLRVVQESVGPDPEFRGYENSAISLFGDFRRTLLTLLGAAEALADFLTIQGVEPQEKATNLGRWNDMLDVLYSVSRLVYPSEKHDYLFDTDLLGFSHARPCMPTSIRDGPPPLGLECNEWAAMYEGDGFTRTFRLPQPIKIK